MNVSLKPKKLQYLNFVASIVVCIIWTFIAIKCKRLPQIKYGKVDPPSCYYGRQEYGKKCKIICETGFKASGPEERICGGTRGTWSSRFEDTSCIGNETIIIKGW